MVTGKSACHHLFFSSLCSELCRFCWPTRNCLGTIFGGNTYIAVDAIYLVIRIRSVGQGRVDPILKQPARETPTPALLSRVKSWRPFVRPSKRNAPSTALT
jgi:hypothetical protein